MGRAREKRGARGAVPWWVRAGVRMLSVLALGLVLQMSGVLHFVTDLWLDEQAAEQHLAAGEDDDDDACPPGCPTCHCVHPSPALVPRVEALEASVLPAFEVTWGRFEEGRPRSLSPPPVYRPPRA
ncbi:MAG: hypothetical protein R3B70_16905 [Polyangiaceae bacterium]